VGLCDLSLELCGFVMKAGLLATVGVMLAKIQALWKRLANGARMECGSS
jgi:hypothetical protein